MHFINKRPKKIVPVFKDFHIEFLKCAEGDVGFICPQGKEIAELVAQAAVSEERVEQQFKVVAMVRVIDDGPAARFKLPPIPAFPLQGGRRRGNPAAFTAHGFIGPWARPISPRLCRG